MKLIINNLMIVVVSTIILQICLLNVCADPHHSLYSSHGHNRPYQKSKNYAYSSPLANESPEYKHKNNYGNTEDFDIFCDETRTKVIGGGKLIKIKENRQCKNKYRGLKQHRRNKQYYYICQQNRIVLARCDKMKTFNDTYKYCVSKNNCDSKALVYDELKHKFNVSQCIASGTFPIDSKPRYYYTCVYLGGKFIQKVCKCPRGTIFHLSTRTCVERLKCLAPLITHSKNIDSDERYRSATVTPPSKNESLYDSQPCDKPESYSSEDSLGYYYKCSLRSDGKYYQVQLKCPPGKSFDSYSKECVSNSNLDNYTDFPEYSIANIIRNKKRNLLKNLPQLLTSQQRRTAKRIELFNIFDSEETEEENINPIVNSNFCGCSDVNKFVDHDKSGIYEIQNTKENEMIQPQTERLKSEYESGYANMETQDESYESCIECISKDNLNENVPHLKVTHEHHRNCHKNVYTTRPTVITTITTPTPVPTTSTTVTTQNSTQPASISIETTTIAVKTTQSTPVNTSSNTQEDTTVTITTWNGNSTLSTEEPSTISVVDSSPSIIIDESFLTIERSKNSEVLMLTEQAPLINSLEKPIIQIQKIIDDTEPPAAVTKIVTTLLKSAPILNLKNLNSEQLGSSTFLFDSSIQQTTTREEKPTSISTTTSTEQPFTSIFPNITNNSLSQEQTNSTILSTIWLESGKLEPATPEKQLTSLSPTTTSDNIILSEQPDTIKFTTSSKESSTTHSTTPAEESILVTPPTFLENTLTTTAALTETNTNKATTEYNLMPSMNSSQLQDTSILLTTPSPTTTGLDIILKPAFYEVMYRTSTTSTTDIQTVTNNISISSITRTTSTSVDRETPSNVLTTKSIEIANVSTETLTIPKITTNGDIERDIEKYSEINSSESESSKKIYNFADSVTTMETTNSPFMDKIYNSSTNIMITTSIAAEQETTTTGVTPKSFKIDTISMEKLIIPEITTSEDIERDIENSRDSQFTGNESDKENYKDNVETVQNDREIVNDWKVLANSETLMQSTNSQISDGNIDSSSITNPIGPEHEATSNVSTTKINGLVTIYRKKPTIPEITTSEDIERDIENYSDSNAESESVKENTTMESKNSTFLDKINNSSSNTLKNTTSITTDHKATSIAAIAKRNEIATISMEKLIIPEITTSENIENDIDNYNESNRSESESDSETTLKSTDSSFMNFIIDNAFDVRDNNENHSGEKNDRGIKRKNNDTGRDKAEDSKTRERLDKLSTDSEITTHRSNFEFISAEYSEELGHTSKTKGSATITGNKNKSYSTESENHKKLPEITESEIIGNSAAEGESNDNGEVKLTKAKQSSLAETNTSPWIWIENEPGNSKNSDNKTTPTKAEKSIKKNLNSSANKILKRLDSTSTISDYIKTESEKIKNGNSEEIKIKMPNKINIKALKDKIVITKSKRNKSDKDKGLINNLRSSANNQSTSKLSKQNMSKFNNKNEEINKSNETGVPKSNNDTRTDVTVKIDNQPLLATLNDDGIYEIGRYDNNDKEVIYDSLSTTCACESFEDQFNWDSNSKESDDCCCGCIINDTSDSGPADITM